MPNDPKNPRNPDIDSTKKAERERELEDQVGRDPDAKPDLVPPGTIDEALIADRVAQRSSDRMDGRDGVDNSDMIGNDPDAAGKPRRSRKR